LEAEGIHDYDKHETLQALVSWSVRGIVVGGIGGGRTERAYAEAAVKVRAGKIKTVADLLKELSPIIPDDDTFIDSFRRARQTRPRISRYLLLALERAARKDSEPEMVPNDNEDEVNLEHILPRNAKESDWRAFKPEEVTTWANRLGNHCLLKKSENTKIGNKPWRVKKPILQGSSLKLTKLAGAKRAWTKKEIEDRQDKLASYALGTWPRRPR
jgi:hypothetical protein